MFRIFCNFLVAFWLASGGPGGGPGGPGGVPGGALTCSTIVDEMQYYCR